MPDFLVFQIYGALASWGNIAVGEHRPSLGHPTKSAVNGLLAAAMGIDRGDDEKHRQLSQQYGVAVCVRASGELLRDYHTIQVPGGKREYASRRDELLLPGFNSKTFKSNLEAIISKRDYRTDALYQVAVWNHEEDPLFALDELREKLLNPHFTLYLGRKSCPASLPLFPLVISGHPLDKAFDTYPLDKAANWMGPLKNSELISYYWEAGLSDAELGDLKATMVYPRRDQVSSRQRWQFANRDESYCARTTKGAA